MVRLPFQQHSIYGINQPPCGYTCQGRQCETHIEQTDVYIVVEPRKEDIGCVRFAIIGCGGYSHELRDNKIRRVD